MSGSTMPAWHQALAYALTGQRFDALGRQSSPDLDAVTAFLRPRLGTDVDPAELRQPHPLPADLAAGLSAAQLWAGVTELRRRLGAGASEAAVAKPRPLTTDERRLLQDVPPHHGG